MEQHKILMRLLQQADEAEGIIDYITDKVQQLKEGPLARAREREIRLMEENARLIREIEQLKIQLLENERVAVVDVPLPEPNPPQPSHPAPDDQDPPPTEVDQEEKAADVPLPEPTPPQPSHPAPDDQDPPPTEVDQEEKAADAPLPEPTPPQPSHPAPDVQDPPPTQDIKVDISRLDLRVGCLVSIETHPAVNKLFVFQADVGERSPKTIVTGMPKNVSLEQMQNRLVVLLCNPKPYMVKGLVSQAMILSASTQGAMESLDPPAGAVPGDRIIVQGFEGEPDLELNPKEKVWRQVQPRLRTDDGCVASYEGAALEVTGKGFCKAQTLKNCMIK